MPVEAKPLFRPDVLRPYLRAFQLPAHVPECRPKLAHWAELIASGRADSFKEQEILPDFLTDFFCGLLGYTRPADGGERYTISRERLVEVNGKFADAVLGDFRDGKAQFVAGLGGQGTERPSGSSLMRGGACRRWTRATTTRSTCRATGSSSPRFAKPGSISKEPTSTPTNASTPRNLPATTTCSRSSSSCLRRNGWCPLSGGAISTPCRLHPRRPDGELTKQFYLQYANMRQDAFARLRNKNPHAPPHDVLRSAQKLLDRILFCAFCEKRGLLPPETIAQAYEHRDPYRPRPIWDNFQGLFHAINEGNATLEHSGVQRRAVCGRCGSGLPCKSPTKYAATFVTWGNTIIAPRMKRLRTRKAGSARTLIDVDILGHIFEQSITDLEKIRNELDRIAEPVSLEEHKSRRKKEGAFYTPSFITRYNVQQALGGVLKDRFEQLRQRHTEATKGTARSVLADPNVYDLDTLNAPQRAALVRFWEAWQDELATIRLLDPACGCGAFLIQSFDQLHAAYEASNDRLFELRGHRTLFDLDRQILQNNLYGVDLNEEAIEICKLSLWIKTAQRGKILTSLDHTIRVGNSIVSDPKIDPAAFDWQAAFPEVFATGGFDVVVANPPYVRQELLSPIKPYLEANYKTYHGMADLYVYFYELGPCGC